MEKINNRKLTSFDLKFLSLELNEKLKNARVQKVFSFNPTKKKEDSQIHLLIHIPQQGTHRLIIGNDKIFLTKKPIMHDEVSGNFALYLRKHLKSKRILAVRQHNFDRVAIIEFEDNFLVCEIFAKSNIIFTDKENNILALKTRKIWSGRSLKRYEKYIYPPATKSIFSIDEDELKNMLKKSDKKIIVYLSTQLSFGKEYANIICDMAKINKSNICSNLNEKQASSLFGKITLLINPEKKPFVVEDKNNKIIDYYPVDVDVSASLPEIKEKQFKKSFIDAVEQYCISGYNILEMQKPDEQKEKINKTNRILQNQIKNKEKIQDAINEKTKTINVIKENYEKLAMIMLDIGNALLRYKIKDVKEKILCAKKENKDKNAKIIENIDEKTKEVLFNIDNAKFNLSLNKTTEQNIAFYFDDLKKTKAKLYRLDLIQKQQEMKKDKQTKTIQILKSKTKKHNIVEKKQWYHKFHWFFTSGNILAIGGKTAQQNEEVIKKYSKDNDLIFHCDIAGSPFVVLKSSNSKNKPKDEDLYETAVFAAVYSRAWRIGIGAIEVYWVDKEQVSKKAPSGEFIGTGSFMIYGKKNILKVVLEYAIGFIEGKLIFGSVGAVQKQTNKFIVIAPGDVPKNKLAKQIKEVLAEKLNKEEKEILSQININEIEGKIPGMGGDVKKY